MSETEFNPPEQPVNPIDDLVRRMLDSQWSEADQTELLSKLKDNPEACDRYLDHIMLHAVLGKEFGAYRAPTLDDSLFGGGANAPPPILSDLSGSDLSGSDLSGSDLSGSDFPRCDLPGSDLRGWGGQGLWMSCVIFAIGALAALSGVAVMRPGSVPHGMQRASNDSPRAWTEATPVAFLTSSNGCNWGGKSTGPWLVGRGVRSGDEITLYEGIAEFHLGGDVSNGIALNIEGPAALVVTSPNSLILQYGKVTAHVPWAVRDFRLLAGACRVTGSDTEFGINLTGKSVEVHAFSGEVTVERSPFGGPSPRSKASSIDPDDPEAIPTDEPAVIGEGQGLVYSTERGDLKPPVACEADRGRFATNLSMGGRLIVPRSYVDVVMNADPQLRPLSYWRFESLEGGAVRNEIEGGPKLLVKGELSLSGDEANHSLDLGRSLTSGYLLGDGAVEGMEKDYSVELWAKPSHFHLGVMMALSDVGQDDDGSPLERTGFMLEVLPGYDFPSIGPGCVRLVHRKPPSQRGGAHYSNNLYELRRWQHIVATKQGSTIQLYLDGKNVMEAEDNSSLAAGLVPLLGQYYAMPVDVPLQKFVGQLDELAIYGRALSQEEVFLHCRIIQTARAQGPASLKADSL